MSGRKHQGCNNDLDCSLTSISRSDNDRNRHISITPEDTMDAAWMRAAFLVFEHTMEQHGHRSDARERCGRDHRRRCRRELLPEPSRAGIVDDALAPVAVQVAAQLMLQPAAAPEPPLRGGMRAGTSSSLTACPCPSVAMFRRAARRRALCGSCAANGERCAALAQPTASGFWASACI